ncbi:UDP-N-acetylmuramoyl-L-alanyl-D-glutamate--2,6-diaminopimelate ligase [Nereida sp. MMG025]|uniref:UDP-N-acetylmuramoyl-L-alanyl-D-glutamate--2, 6-diaminopimelate ligase n=1 Tax=Nereida sp. MMG025 TaxID=2909981 RepID=UPI001F006EB1|nr:UDP-N-acetylmuramoyl-L-alanyl-D-glutamate--2,6-diaminopimelate ligase [Nereida sp. MMG025]MCF6445225.1 UDP-N-acetylmuramoyl-L-alanyl-D-glutamate--2,6-diaminopimelate ligase [Nereida sp. MMG025]
MTQTDAQVKKLSELGLTVAQDVAITGVAIDSREVRKGFLFAAVAGSTVHGGEFIQYALRQGAAAVLTDATGAQIAQAELAASDAVLIVVDEPRETLAYICALWFGGQPDTLIAVTGTNGKTSVSTFTRMIWEEMGLPAVNLGTTGVEGCWTAPLQHTTPDPITLHRALAAARENGVTHAAMEASSHGLDQYRLDGCQLCAAGFTNFTQDHLDYHKTFEAYFAAKASLFTRVLAEDGTAVINIDDPKGWDVVALTTPRGIKTLLVGRGADADLQIKSVRVDDTGQTVQIEWQGKPRQIRLNLIGTFQVENALMAAGLVIASGADVQEVFDTLPHLKTVRGRMELAGKRDNGAAVFVDYAHTPDAIASALKSMRPHVMGKLVAVIGAGGDRDTTKRPLMGAEAGKHADVVFVTDDNPRTENPALIRQAVIGGCPDGIEVADRAEAILRAVDTLEAGDALLIAGKGHETGQIVGKDVLPFDDVEQASIAIAALDGTLQ